MREFLHKLVTFMMDIDKQASPLRKKLEIKNLEIDKPDLSQNQEKRRRTR